ncbi:MAG: DUF4118 domain-containing protein [Chthoniobacterales bacterium]
MSEAERPNPDEILARVQREESESARGKLKIFFGMCPGVGKTFAMLQAAQQKLSEGCEVVVGVVETHGRKETEALLEGMPIMPRNEIEYRGTMMSEMDLDAILTWHPGLAVVDELAHTNVPGSRHPKRYQDVLELLDAGIDVYTTLNVQHVESRRDAVYQITGVPVRETIPDSVLDSAQDIVLIDLTPEQLRTRLAEGKVYIGDRAATAAENFFREGNLTALREMSLRLVAEHVDRDLRSIMREEHIAGPWKSGDRLLVAVSASPSSEKLIRYTRRLASTMEASWLVANIDTPRQLTEAEQVQLTRHLTLARQLGAEVISVPGNDVAEALLRIARQHNVTQIVVGKPLRGRFWPRRSPVDWLIRHSGEIDIYMIRSEETAPRPPKFREEFRGARWLEYASATGLVALVTVASLLVREFTGYWAVALFYLLALTLSAMRLHLWPSLYLATLSALCWNYLFIPPRYTFDISQLPDFIMFGAFFIVALVIGSLTTRLRARERAERRREERATSLYRLTRSLAASKTLDEALALAVQLIKDSFNADAAIWLRGESGLTLHPTSTIPYSEKQESVAAWSFQKKQAAGLSTDTLPDAGVLHVPMISGDGAIGVLAIALSPNVEQRELIDAFAAQIAVFVNKEFALEFNRRAQLASQSEKLQKTLFDSVSHELKTPLAAITAALHEPKPDRAEIDQALRRLTRTVDHLLDATRLESGMLQPNREWCDPGELLRETVQLAQIAPERVSLRAAPGLKPIFVDARLLQQALMSVLANAERFEPEGKRIFAGVAQQEDEIIFTVMDDGPGIPAGDEEKIFEKFYRSAGKRTGGLGLGLAIARQLIQVHGGEIVARNRAEGGAQFIIRLPLGKPMQMPADLAS